MKIFGRTSTNTKVGKELGRWFPDLAFDISQSPWTSKKWKARDRMLERRVKDLQCPIIYVNSVGLQNNAKNLVWFDGGSCLMGQDGKMKWMGEINKETATIINPNALEKNPKTFPHPPKIEEKYHAIISAMRDFYSSHKKVVIGLSGGIDSAVSLALHVKALGKNRVITVNMPTRFNSNTTKLLASVCAKNFGVEYRIAPIENIFEAHLKTLLELGHSVSSFDKENIQARIRGSVLADISACEATRHGGKVSFTCNGNKTEVALNYFTLYGDGAGGSAFLADLWKGEIYELAEFINKTAGENLIPRGILEIVPSAELSSDQNVDEGKGDPIFYPFHDKLLSAFTEKRWNPRDILERAQTGGLEEALGCKTGTIPKYFKNRDDFVKSIEWAWRGFSFEGKRHMLPPCLITSRRAFGFDRRETIAEGYLGTQYIALKKEYLGERVAI